MADNNKNNQKKEIRRFEFRINLNLKNILIWTLVFIFGFSFLLSLGSDLKKEAEISLSSALADIKEGKVKEILVEGEKLTLIYKEGDKVFITRKEPGDKISDVLKSADIDPTSINLKIKDQAFSRLWIDVLGTIFPLILMGLFFYFILRQARGAQDTIFSFGQSRARLFAKGRQNITFKDVAGVDEAKKELQEVVDFLKHPGKYRSLGARTPKGVLLVGPSGTGKTLLAKAVAGEAGVPFFSMAGSEFMEMLVGVGAARVRDLFNNAKRAAPSIIFIDEIDAIGRMRGFGIAGGHDEREQTLNQILVEMDGFTPNDNVIVIAASVVGETPILIKKEGEIKLISIGEFVDHYFSEGEEGEKELKNEVFCLGFERKESKGNLTRNNLYFGGSSFKRIRSVFRHKVKEIYEIDYLGGKIRATGSHSVFVRSRKGIEVKAVANLEKGDVLVDLPFKVNRTKKEKMEIRAHHFEKEWELFLPIFDPPEEKKWEERYLFATQNLQGLFQDQIGQILGVSQGTVSCWQRGISTSRQISKKYFKHHFPWEIKVTPQLCRLMGYYVAEGYSRWELDFCFSIRESEKIQDLVDLMEEIFGLKPDYLKHITPGAVNIVYSAAPLARFFAYWCGRGAENKHLPSFLFEAPWEYFKEFLKGVWAGDGYEDKEGKGEITSVSKRLILELNWLCRMHGIKTYINKFVAKEGRRIKNGKPLAETLAYRLGWGKTNNPFNYYSSSKNYPVKRAIVREVRKIPFNGFVYDLCGVENEAFFGGENPILLHNTNRGDLLDPALLRPGRFDRRIVLDLPDMEARKAILAIHARGKPFAPEVEWEAIAKRTVGFSGADLENMLNEAAILAAREGKKTIGMEEINEAAVKVKLGPAKKKLQSEEDKKLTAYHEAGHALVSFHLPHMDPVSRISIVARGVSLGHTLIPPSADRTHETKSHLLEQITALLGGRAAEDIVFSEMTTGAANDIEQATRIARAMVVDFGMSDLGPLNLGPQIEYSEMGRALWMEPSQLSPEMAAKVDREVKKIVDSSYQKALEILKKSRKKLDLVAQALIEKETLEQEDFEKIVGKKTPLKTAKV
jgi:ATP-dependent Zn protease